MQAEETEIFASRTLKVNSGKCYENSWSKKLQNNAAEEIGYQLIDCKKYTLKFSIKAILIDEAAGEEKREVTLKKGERITYFRTDNKSYAGLRRADGMAVRVHLKHRDWYYTLNGKPVAKIFKGIVYAG